MTIVRYLDGNPAWSRYSTLEVKTVPRLLKNRRYGGGESGKSTGSVALATCQLFRHLSRIFLTSLRAGRSSPREGLWHGDCPSALFGEEMDMNSIQKVFVLFLVLIGGTPAVDLFSGAGVAVRTIHDHERYCQSFRGLAGFARSKNTEFGTE